MHRCRHVHSYERMNRVYNYSVDPCGPIYVTVGDGGRSTPEYTPHDKSNKNPGSPYHAPSLQIRFVILLSSPECPGWKSQSLRTMP